MELMDGLASPVRRTFIRPRLGMTGPRILFCWGLAVALCMSGICAAILFEARLDASNHAADTSHNLALLVERDIGRNIELYDLSIQAVVEGCAIRRCAICRCICKGRPSSIARRLRDMWKQWS